jgi:hypothetical protein
VPSETPNNADPQRGQKYRATVVAFQFAVFPSTVTLSAVQMAFADQPDLESSADNVINLFQPQLALDEAWPGFTFEKIDAERASLILGMFIDGSLIDDTTAVIARIEHADLFRKLVNYVVDRADPQFGIARAKLVAAWMADQAKPSLAGLKKAAEHQKIVLAAQKEFAELVEVQVEVVGSHLQQLNTIYHKHHP